MTMEEGLKRLTRLALKMGKGDTGQRMQATSRSWEKQNGMEIESPLESRKEGSPKDPMILIQ